MRNGWRTNATRKTNRRRLRPAVELLEDRNLLSGSLDPSFGAGGTLTTDFFNANRNAQPQNLVVQPDGKTVVVGSAADGTGKSYVTLARYTADGSLDPTFGTNGWVASVVPGASTQGGQSVALDAAGNILVGGPAGPAHQIRA